jgi:broad specificity polyphosphatase/5'/3'-nucleotidase SurE
MSVSSAIVTAVLRVFLDCNDDGCHADYLREEVKLADYVRDRTDADVHVLVTSAETGAGGREYTLGFIGLGPFQAVSRTL